MANAATSHDPGATHESKPVGLNHMSIPVKDVDQAERFWISVVGAEPFQHRHDHFCEVKLGELVIGLSKQAGGWTAPDAEFPHYGFLVEPTEMWPIKERLEQHGIPTHPIWTRNGYTGLMYFRDPSGNLFELYCPRVRDEDAPKMVHGGDMGTYRPPIASLSYEWNG